MIFPTKPFKLRFSLRALLVAMTLFALFLGYHLNWIRQRRIAFEASYGHKTSGVDRAQASLVEEWQAVGNQSDKRIEGARRKMPLMLRLLGARPYPIVAVSDSEAEGDEEQQRRLQALFPEADVLLFGF